MSQPSGENKGGAGQSADPTLGSALRASSTAFIFVGIFSFFINLLMLTGPLFMLQIYDRVLASRSLPTLALLFILVAGLFAAMGFLEFVRTRVLARIGAHVDQRISQRVFDSSMQVSLRSGGSASSTSPLRELSVVQQFLSGPGLPALFDAPWVPVYIFVIFLFHPDLGLLAVVAAVILFIIALLNDIRSRKPMAQLAEATGAENQIAQAGARNAEVLAAMGMLGAIRRRWMAKHLDVIEYQTQTRDRSGTLSALSKALRLFFQSAMLAAGAALVIFGEITPGVMIAASIILGRALQPVEQAITHWRGMIQYRHAKTKLDKLFAQTPSQKEKMSLPTPLGKIEVRSLAVAVPGTRNIILQNINFALEPGKTLGIIGRSAAGKSTLARVLVGVWPPVGGEVRLDGATYDQWHPDDLGQHIGYLPQSVELFSGSVQENIARFDPQAEPEQIIEAAKQAGIHEMIKKLGGYDTEIGFMGANLSSGQRQRLALARALYGNPKLIVLDEPNSNLDEEGEKALAGAIIGMRKRGQTLIFVSHRMNILGLTDYLLELNEGTQLTFGSRDEVIEKIKKQQTGTAARGGRKQSGKPPATPVQVAQAGWQRSSEGKHVAAVEEKSKKLSRRSKK